MRAMLALFTFSLLSACAALRVDSDRAALTTFERAAPGDPGADYVYRANADVVYPSEDPDAERMRLRWLAQWAAENHACPGGFAVSSRDEIKVTDRLSRLTYRVACRKRP